MLIKRGNSVFNHFLERFFYRRKAQVSIFIILGIIVVLGVGIFLFLRGGFEESGISAEFQPVHNTLLSCIEENTETGINILGSQGGYIYLPEFQEGSRYMPFSSQLDFLGNPIPYWYYISGNNIEKEQVPSKRTMENELERYIEESVKQCDFSSYYDMGYQIEMGNPSAEANINDKEVEVILDMDLGIILSGDSVFIDNHELILNSNLGKLYDSAKQIYEVQQEKMFLENYGIDILRLYAPVDGVEMGCSPKTWNAEDVFNELEEAIEANTLSLRNRKGDYSLTEKEHEYFLVDLGVEENVRFFNSRKWPNSFEVFPTQGNSPLMIASPVGNQPGLGAIGFCYVPYHFVYDVKYPVLVQISEKGDYSGEEVFQFPLAVVIRGNKPREPQEGAISSEGNYPEICEYKNTLIEVNTYDKRINPVDANISFDCFGSFCDIGKTTQGRLNKEFPQCNNGFIIAEAEGYKIAKYVFSTTNERSVDIILDKSYELAIDLMLDGRSYNENAIISFVSEDISETVIYPENTKVELSSGQYEILVQAYRNSSIKLSETTYEQCFDIPKSGVGGFVGMSEKKCVEAVIPSQIISNALAGGGREKYYILESELSDSKTIVIDGERFDTPRSLEDLQKNYNEFENSDLRISFR